MTCKYNNSMFTTEPPAEEIDNVPSFEEYCRCNDPKPTKSELVLEALRCGEY